MDKEHRFGLLKVTLADFPGEVAATIFTAGCNLLCPYCHNFELISGSPPGDFLEEVQIFEYLNKRKSTLGGVCITGGEPLLFPEIDRLCKKIKAMGFKLKIDTNGTFPEKILDLNPDYIAMDIKTSPKKYPLLGADQNQIENIVQSIQIILNSKIEHEFRTTVTPGIVDEEDIKAIVELIKGCHKYTLTEFSPTKCLDPEMTKQLPYPRQTMEQFLSIALDAGINAKLRSR